MKRVLFIGLVLVLGSTARAQLTGGTLLPTGKYQGFNKSAIATGQKLLDGKMSYYDTINFVSRPFLSITEANAFLPVNQRAYTQVVLINSGGTLNTTGGNVTYNGIVYTPGEIIGGVNSDFWYRNNKTNSGLVAKTLSAGEGIVIDSVYGTITSTAGGCTWPSEASIGKIYSKKNWSNATDFTANGAITVGATAGYINLSNGGASFNDYVTIGTPTNLNKWHINTTVKLTSLTGGSGIGIGLRWANTNNKFDIIGSMAFNSGGNTPVYIARIGGGASVYETSGDAMFFTTNDIIDVNVDFNINAFTVSIRNITQNGPTITGSKVWINPNNGGGMPNTGNFVIYSYGGTQQLQSLDITSNATKNSTLLIAGDSKTQGFYSDQWSTSFPNLLNTVYPTTTFRAGEGDGVQQTLAGISELLLLHPQQVIMNIGSNDFRASRTFSQVTADYSSVVTQLTSAGIKVLHIVMPEDSTLGGVGMTSFRNWVAVTYGANYISQVWDTLATGNILKAAFQHDAVHMNQAGNDATSIAIIGSGKVAVCADRSKNALNYGSAGYISRFSNSSSIESSGIFQSGSRFGINTTTPQSILDIAQNTPGFNTAQFGSFSMQSIGTANGFISNNSRFDGITTKRRNTGPVGVYQQFDSSHIFYAGTSGPKDSTVNILPILKIGRNFTSKDMPLTIGANTIGTDTIPFFGMSYKTGGTDEKNWDEYVGVKNRYFRLVSDNALAVKNWMTVSRTGLNVDSVNVPNSPLFVKGIIRSDSGLTVNSLNGFPVNINSTGTSSYINLNNITASPNVGMTYKFGGTTKWTTAAYTNFWGLYNNTASAYAVTFDSLTNQGTFTSSVNIPTESTGDSSNKAASTAWVKRQLFGTGGGGSGSVTSVALALPSMFSVTGSPVTGSGTLTGALATQTANTIFAGPTTGSAAAPTFRSIVSADIPSSVALAGSPTTTTATALDSSGKIATTAYVDRATSKGAVTYKSYGGGADVLRSVTSSGDTSKIGFRTIGTMRGISVVYIGDTLIQFSAAYNNGYGTPTNGTVTGAGTGASVSFTEASAQSTDASGIISVTTGSSGTLSTIGLTINFSASYAGYIPKIILTGIGAASDAIHPYVATSAFSGFSFATTGTAAYSTTYRFQYVIVP